ncbi:hypothetical protein ACUN7V_20890 [Quadrisphaera oryzae]|uniref:hypothetical protein n=1 Tax=Quadrisphaera TaxID=317661 RepID=UPI001C94C002|nr:hypothetical protein [Quadrisphaera sp. RL12-1S]
MWDDIGHLEAHHSTALGGNTLVLREVEALLERQRPVGDEPLREHLTVQGCGDAARWVYTQAHDRSRHDRFIIPSIAGPARMVPLAVLVTPEIALVALRHAARRGRLESYQDADGTWRSSRHAVDQYLASRFRRSAPPA